MKKGNRTSQRRFLCHVDIGLGRELLPILADMKKMQRDIEATRKRMRRDTGKENLWTFFCFNHRAGDKSTKASIKRDLGNLREARNFRITRTTEKVITYLTLRSKFSRRGSEHEPLGCMEVTEYQRKSRNPNLTNPSTQIPRT